MELGEDWVALGSKLEEDKDFAGSTAVEDRAAVDMGVVEVVDSTEDIQLAC